MNHCCVPFCKSARGRKEKIGFFEFPSKVQQRALWQNIIINATSRSNIEIEYKFLDRSVVCEKHFTVRDFSRSTKRRRILPGVVPSIFTSSSPTKQKNILDQRESLNVPLNPLLKDSCLTEKFETNFFSGVNSLKNNSFKSYNFIGSGESYSGKMQNTIKYKQNNKQADFSPLSNKVKCCCVPHCKSFQGGKENVSFFEFPSNLQQRAWWKKIITQVIIKSGYTWKPSDQSVVCGKHFMETDFSKNSTKRKLLPGVVPSVFSNFPSNRQKKLDDQIKISSKMNSLSKKPCLSAELEDNALFSLSKEENNYESSNLNQNVDCHTGEIEKNAISKERSKQLINKLHRRFNSLRKMNYNVLLKLKGLD